MVFSSAPFIFIFLPVVFILYAITPGLRGKNVLLTIASLLFYAYGEPAFALVMVGSVVMNYIFALIIAKTSSAEAVGGAKEEDTGNESPDETSLAENAEIESRGEIASAVEAEAGETAVATPTEEGNSRVKHTAAGKMALAVSVIMNLALIGVFKYAGFFVQSLNDAAGTTFRVPEIALPIGISFFTFQAMSYVIDVYRDPGTVQKNLGKVLLYISFFPQLIAGPIVKYHDIAPYLNERHMDPDEITAGINRFVTGLAKKMFLANAMGAVADQMFNMPVSDMSSITAWMGAVCYTLQIFFDFSGYSDMAIGIGHMFGFTIKENFDHPYISCSIKEFWRRWHISLSTWFKEYLYIPMGGSRHGKLRTELNKMIVFFLTGLWHGASWNFVVWGMIHGVAISLEDLAGLKGKDPNKEDTERKGCVRAFFGFFGSIFGWVYTIFIVILAFVLFRADTLSQGIVMIQEMFTGGLGNMASYNTCMEALSFYNIAIFAAALFICVPHPFLNRIFREKGPLAYIVTIALFALCVLEIAGASFNPFIYFRF